ncbi:MAG: hypothetical protein ABTQ25_02655, partial [Nitrosomonas ureae]
SDPNIEAVLAQADEHLMYSRWEDAIACFDQVLIFWPEHSYAREKQQQALALRTVDMDILQHLDAARTALGTGHYYDAWFALDQGYRLSFDNELFANYADIELIREETLNRMLSLSRLGATLAATSPYCSDRNTKQQQKLLDSILANDVIALGEPNVDPCMQELLSLLQERLRASRFSLIADDLKDARALVESGAWDKAKIKIAHLKSYSDEAPDINAELAGLEETIETWQKIIHLSDKVLLLIRASQKQKARVALRQLLKNVAVETSGLSQVARSQLTEILALENHSDPLEIIKRATSLQDNLLMSERPDARLIQMYLSIPLSEWSSLIARDASLRLVNAALVAGTAEDAYECAINNIRLNPDDEEMLACAVRAREKIIDRLVTSIEEAMQQANALQQKGMWLEALHQLQQIYSDIVLPVGQRFPEIVNGDPDIDRWLSKAVLLQGELEIVVTALQPAYTYLTDLLYRIYMRHGISGVDQLIGFIQLPPIDFVISLQTLSQRIEKIENTIKLNLPYGA